MPDDQQSYDERRDKFHAKAKVFISEWCAENGIKDMSGDADGTVYRVEIRLVDTNGRAVYLTVYPSMQYSFFQSTQVISEEEFLLFAIANGYAK